MQSLLSMIEYFFPCYLDVVSDLSCFEVSRHGLLVFERIPGQDFEIFEVSYPCRRTGPSHHPHKPLSLSLDLTSPAPFSAYDDAFPRPSHTKTTENGGVGAPPSPIETISRSP